MTILVIPPKTEIQDLSSVVNYFHSILTAAWSDELKNLENENSHAIKTRLLRSPQPQPKCDRS